LPSTEIQVRQAEKRDLEALKAIVDGEKEAFGFITRGTLRQAIDDANIVVATLDGEIVGFQHYYHRKRDLQTTLYHKAVLPEHRRKGIATRLVDAVVQESREMGRKKLLLKCPVDLAANRFHRDYGFALAGRECGKVRELNVWVYHL